MYCFMDLLQYEFGQTAILVGGNIDNDTPIKNTSISGMADW